MLAAHVSRLLLFHPYGVLLTDSMTECNEKKLGTRAEVELDSNGSLTPMGDDRLVTQLGVDVVVRRGRGGVSVWSVAGGVIRLAAAP